MREENIRVNECLCTVDTNDDKYSFDKERVTKKRKEEMD